MTSSSLCRRRETLFATWENNIHIELSKYTANHVSVLTIHKNVDVNMIMILCHSIPLENIIRHKKLYLKKINI